MYGDMGSLNAQSIPRLINEVTKKTIDIVLHVGDFAYNLDDVSQVWFESNRSGDHMMFTWKALLVINHNNMLLAWAILICTQHVDINEVSPAF